MRLTSPQTDEEFARYYDLRWRLLRAPWGQPRGSERDELDADSFHLMASASDGRLIAVGRLHRVAGEQGQIRYMGVLESQRGRGIGSRLLAALERQAKETGLRLIVLDARESAVGFYERHGYGVVGLGHTLFGSIRHSRMTKDL